MYGRTTYPCSAMTNVTIPYLSRTPCPPSMRRNKTSVGYCPPVQITRAALSESDRMAAQVCPATVRQITSGSCDVSGSQGSLFPQTTIVTMRPGDTPPYVTVGSVSASTSTVAKQQQILEAANNPYNPATRFSQYFPPAPIPYCRPIRYPSNDPKPSVNTCLPIRRFTGIPGLEN